MRKYIVHACMQATSARRPHSGTVGCACSTQQVELQLLVQHFLMYMPLQALHVHLPNPSCVTANHLLSLYRSVLVRILANHLFFYVCRVFLIDRSCLDLSATSVNGIGKVNEFQMEQRYNVCMLRGLNSYAVSLIASQMGTKMPAVDGALRSIQSVVPCCACLYLSILRPCVTSVWRILAVASALCHDTTSLAFVLLPLIGKYLLFLRRTQIESISFSEQVATTTDAAALLTAFGGHLLLGVLDWVRCPTCPAPLKRACHDILAVCIAQGQPTQPVALCGHWCQSVHMYGSDLCPFIWPVDIFY